MQAEHRPVAARDGLDRFTFFLLAAVLVFAPLVKGGNRPLPLLTLELAALGLLGAVALLAHPRLRPFLRQRLSGGLLLGLGLLLALPLLQLVPLPFALWQSLPGRELYAEGLAAFGTTGDTGLALLPPLAVFLVVVCLREGALRKIVYLFIAMATLQAILALVQFGGGASTTFRTSLSDIGTGVGTYVNRNHLAGLLAMALPLSLGLLASRIGRGREGLRYRSRNWFRRLASTLAHPTRINQTLIFAAVCIAILLGIIFSRSRSGISLAMLGILISAVIYGLRIGGQRSTKLVMLFSVVGLALAVEVGLAPVLTRFSMGGALEDARWTIFASSGSAVASFFPFGSGLGTFPEVYRRFQPDAISQFVNHAHNDYLEFLFEGGIVAAAVMLVFLFVYFRAWPRLLRLQRWGTLSFMQAGAGIGLAMMALHGLTDYNWRIPANAIYFALMAGVFLHRGEREPDAPPTRQRTVEPAPQLPVPAVRPQVSNPFAE